MCIKQGVRHILVCTVLAALLSGCYFEQGQIHFDELGLDPITVYKMEPLAKTVYCLAEANMPSGSLFDSIYDARLAEVENDPDNTDWSELVCMTFSDEADKQQIKQTINALQLILAVQPKKSHPARGFKKILDQRLELHEQLGREKNKLKVTVNDFKQQITVFQEELENRDLQLDAQRKKIEQLEIQVQKLKEVELMLHPQQ